MDRLRSVEGLVRTGGDQDRPQPGRVLPFITIARQAGAGGTSLMQHLLPRLRTLDPGDPPWTGYDREVIEQTAEKHGLHPQMLESLEEQPNTWLDDLFVGLSTETFSYSEMVLARRVARTIRDIAERGRAIIVGRGGVFVTRGMAKGIHLYLVAPHEDRVERMRRQLNLTPTEAAAHVDRLDRNRRTFYSRYYPLQPVGPEQFTLTINTSAISDETAVETVLAAMAPMLERPRPAQLPQTQVQHV